MNESTQSSQARLEALHHTLVERMVADLRPVRRLWPLTIRLALWIALELGVLLLIVHGTHRADLAQQLTNPWYLLGVGGFAVGGAIGAAFALRAAVPGREPRPIEIGLLLMVAVASALLLLHEPPNAKVPLERFIGVGLRCARQTLVLAALPWIALGWAVRRGAPLFAAIDGTLIGAAALFCSIALMRVICPIDEALHLLIWHLLPAIAGIALSAWTGALLLKRRVRN